MVSVVLALALGVIGCAKKIGVGNNNVNQNQNINANTNTATTAATSTVEIDTSDWKTYRNEEYGFEFRYPESIGGKKINMEFQKPFYFKSDLFFVAITPSGYQDYMFIIRVLKNDNKTIKNYLPSKVAADSEKYERNYDCNGTEIVGYQKSIISEFNDNEFINQWILLNGDHYDYLLTSGFENLSYPENTFADFIDNIISSFKVN